MSSFTSCREEEEAAMISCWKWSPTKDMVTRRTMGLISNNNCPQRRLFSSPSPFFLPLVHMLISLAVLHCISMFKLTRSVHKYRGKRKLICPSNTFRHNNPNRFPFSKRWTCREIIDGEPPINVQSISRQP